MDFKKELLDIEEQVNNNKIEKAKLEERLSQLNKEKEEIIIELKKEKINPEELVDVISEIEMELQEGITKCKEILR